MKQFDDRPSKLFCGITQTFIFILIASLNVINFRFYVCIMYFLFFFLSLYVFIVFIVFHSTSECTVHVRLLHAFNESYNLEFGKSYPSLMRSLLRR